MEYSNTLAGAVDWWQLEQTAAPKFADKNLGFVISQIIPYIIWFAGILMLLYLIYSGYQYMLSNGDPKGMEQAKKNITYAIVGFIVILTAYWVTSFFGYAFDLQKIRIIFQ